MTEPRPDPLENLLDAAGGAVQPTVPGWKNLPTRLANIPQQYLGTLGRWGTLPIGAAAVAAMVLIALLTLWPRNPLQAREQPIEVRRQSVDLTILSVSETEGETLYMPMQEPSSRRKKATGQALVKDRRLVLHLKTGDNVVRFTDVAASIDPTSVRFESLTDPKGTTVVEQAFEYDLANADALLKRFVDREIVCVDKDGQEIAGRLASYDDAAIVMTVMIDQERSTQNVSRGSLQAIRLSEMPFDLIVKPTLVWKLRTNTPGQHETMLSYICGLMHWHANYVIEVTPGEGGQPDLLDFDAWVTLQNTSGSTYPQAGLRLIAGDVRRLRDPWFRKLPPDYAQLAIAPPLPDLGVVILRANNAQDLEKFLFFQKEFAEQSLFEYHLYTLNTPCTIADHQIKQLSLLKKQAVTATRRYLFDPAAPTPNLAIELLIKNEKENNLGLPLPKGNVTLEQRDRDGEPHVIGQTEIDHTAVKEELKLQYGHAFDVLGEHRTVLVEKLGKNSRVTYETRIRNHKAAAVTVRSFALWPPGHGTIVQSSLPWQTGENMAVYFEFELAGNAERKITYSVVYRSE